MVASTKASIIGTQPEDLLRIFLDLERLIKNIGRSFKSLERAQRNLERARKAHDIVDTVDKAFELQERERTEQQHSFGAPGPVVLEQLAATAQSLAHLTTSIEANRAAWQLWGQDVRAVVENTMGTVDFLLVDRFAETVDGLEVQMERARDSFRKLENELVGDSIVPEMIDAIEAQFGRLEGIMGDPARHATAMVEGSFDDMAGAVKGGIDAVLRDLEKGELSFRSFVDSVQSALSRIASREVSAGIESLIDKILGSITGDVLGGGSAVVPWVDPDTGKVLVPRRHGGPVSPNRAFLVGEEGPELFEPPSAGTIVPNDELAGQGAGGPTVIVNNTFNFPPGTDVAGFRRSEAQIRRAMVQAARVAFKRHV